MKNKGGKNTDNFKEQLLNIGIEESEQIEYLKLIQSVPQNYKTLFIGFILKLATDGKRLKTIESYLIDLKQLIKYIDLKEKNINQLEAGDIERYKKNLLRDGLKPKSINRKLTSINQLLKYNNSQVRYKKIKEQKKNFLNDVLSKEEVERLLNSCGDNLRNKTIMLTLYKTGLRVSELLRLTIKDVNKNMIAIEGKGGKYRSIPISKDVREAWEEYLKVRIPSDKDKLFTGTQGALKRNSINKIITKYGIKTRIKKEKAHPHSFRHAFCKALAGTVPINVIADLAGHESIETTRIYTMQTEKELRDILERM